MDPPLAHEDIRFAVGRHASIGVFGVGAHKDHVRLRQFSPDASRQFESIEVGHLEVRDDDVGPLALYDSEPLLTVCRLTDDLHVGRGCEQVADDLAILHSVIDDDDGQKNSPLLARRDAKRGQLTSEPRDPATFFCRL